MPISKNVLVLGGTGSIGGPVAEVLKARGHDVTCLARSSEAETNLSTKGFKTMRGDIRTPETWIAQVETFDAVIHAAITWSDDMDAIDCYLTSELLAALQTPNADKTLIYTSGCWAYGATGDTVATEQTNPNPLLAFDWMKDASQLVIDKGDVRGIVILPAMVYERDGGVLDQMVDDARTRDKVRIVGHEGVRWTLVHRSDLATLYALALEHGQPGKRYNGAGIVSMEVCQIARTIANRYGKTTELEVLTTDQAIREWAPWAAGYGLDQQMSSQKAMTELGWQPKHTDILAELS